VNVEPLLLWKDIEARCQKIGGKVWRARALLDARTAIDARAAAQDLWAGLTSMGLERDQTYRPMGLYAFLAGMESVWDAVEISTGSFPEAFTNAWPDGELCLLLGDLEDRFKASIALRAFVLDSRPEDCEDLSAHVAAIAGRSQEIAAVLVAEVPRIHAAWIREWCDDNRVWAIGYDEIPF